MRAWSRPGQPDVGGVLPGSRDLVHGVEPPGRAAHDRELRHGPQHRLLVHRPRDRLALREGTVGDLSLRLSLHGDDALLDDEPVPRDAQPLRGEAQEDLPRFGRRGAQRGTEPARGLRAERPHVPGAAVGVAQDHLDRVEAHAQLLGRHLGEGRVDALPHLDLPGEDGDAAVLADAEVGVDVGGIAAALGEGALRAEADEDDDAPAHELQERATVEGAAHGRPPSLRATDSMASRIRL